tara:strand:- start:39456 stop:39728 length:273 start_codon:yes stop_codon:yes gene_type:complete
MNIENTNPLYNSIINGTNNLLSTQQKISIVRSQAQKQISQNNNDVQDLNKKDKEVFENTKIYSLEEFQNKKLERYIQAAKVGNKNLLAIV